MAKEINVILSSKTTLVLEEDANKGDFINLNSISSYDHEALEKIFDNAKESYISQRINKEVNALLTNEVAKFNDSLKEKDKELSLLRLEYDNLVKSSKKELESVKENIRLSVEQEKSKEISDLKLQLSSLNSKLNDLSKENEVKLTKELATLKVSYENKIKDLENEVNNLKTNQNLTIEIEKNKIKEDLNKQISDLTLSKEQLKVDLNKEKEEEINALKKEISLKQERINQLELNKSSLNVKRLGEELEKWCQNEYESYSNAGAFLNSSFIKDNDVVKEEDESKGSKGDFIFKHYSSSDFKDENLLTSICLEMKNESNVSTHKKTNASYFTQLDKNRNKKKLEYALLVSELEWDSANDVPIKKVNEYEKMFIVRPPYFISFISLLVALSDKYKDILVEVSKTKEEFKKSDDVIKEFDEFKRKYLEDIMSKLNKKISKIGEDAKKINDLSVSIMNDSNDIINGFINEMKLKIDRFDISKIARKLDRLED